MELQKGLVQNNIIPEFEKKYNKQESDIFLKNIKQLTKLSINEYIDYYKTNKKIPELNIISNKKKVMIISIIII